MMYIVQLFTGAAGSVAFGILFHMKKKHLPLAALGGFLGLAVIYHLQRILGRCVLPDIGSSFWNRLICGDTCA